MATVTPLQRSAYSYLQERGIKREHIEALGLEIKSHSALSAITPKIPHRGAEMGIVWRVQDLYGKDTKNIGVRLLYPSSGFGAITQPNLPKFVVPAKQRGRLYHSPLCDWKALKPNTKIYICESWLKADVMAILGYYAVGVQGIWGWSGSEKLMEDFGRLISHSPQFIALFDSNVYAGKRLNRSAVESLHTELETLDSGVKWIPLPPKVDGDGDDRIDWGLDDLRVARGDAALRAIADIEPLVVESNVAREIRILDREVAYVRSVDRVVDVDTGILYNANQAIRSRWANRMFTYMDGEKPKRVNTCRMWLEWRDRRTVNELAYLPGRPRINTEEGYFNLWKGYDVEPEAGDCALYEEWLHEITENEAQAQWVDRWLAWPFQNPAGRMTTALALLGKSGVGKGWLAELLHRIYGDNFAKINLRSLLRSFNAHYAIKQFVCVEEGGSITGRTASDVNDAVKDFVTEHLRTFEMKGIDARQIPAVGHLMIQGNDIDVMRIDEHDRRISVVWIEGTGIANDPEYWNPRWEWLEDAGPAAMLHRWLELDLTDFDPQGKPPASEAKKMMVGATRSPMEVWLEDIISGDPLLSGMSGVVLDGYVFTARELAEVYSGTLEDPMASPRDDVVRMMNRLLQRRMVPYATTDTGSEKINIRANKKNPYPHTSARYFVVRSTRRVLPAAEWVKAIRLRNVNKFMQNK